MASLSGGVADSHHLIHFNADPDPAFHFNVDPNTASHQNMGTCPLVFDPARLHFNPPGLYCEHPRASRALFQPLKLLNFVFHADTVPDYKSNADPDPQGP
jgi:hypothetical protein